MMRNANVISHKRNRIHNDYHHAYQLRFASKEQMATI
jgi:hypothetical protein